MIDTHHHFWRYTPAEYGWIDESKAVLRRDFLPDDLREAIAAADVDGVISVQARQSIEETHWLLEFAAQHKFIRAVVGWAPLAAVDAAAQLQSVVHHTKLRSMRHLVQDEVDDEFILREDFNRGVSLLKDMNLRYDIVIYERHLPPTVKFVDRHPSQIFILDHIAKPKIKADEMEPWATNIRDLARRPNVYCKISGMVTEADWRTWTTQSLKPYFDVVLEAFTPRRLMVGTDWPVCLLACGYKRWMDIVREWAEPLSAAEKKRFFDETAVEAYGLTEG
jgi:L-fuconolactonase